MVLNKACCCIDLAVGAEILGWLGVISGMIHMVNTQTQSYPGITTENENAELLGCAIQIIISSCLASGVRMKNKALLLPWLILNMIGIVLINFSIFGQAGHLIRQEDVAPISAGLFIVDLIFGYLWLIVLSLFNNFDQQRRMVAIVYNNFDKTTLIPPEKNGVENHV